MKFVVSWWRKTRREQPDQGVSGHHWFTKENDGGAEKGWNRGRELHGWNGAKTWTLPAEEAVGEGLGQQQSWCVGGTADGQGLEQDERIETVGGGSQEGRQSPDGRGHLWGYVTAPH